MNRAQDILLGEGIVIGDGAMGTMLHSLGASLSQSFDELNLSCPDLVSSVHRAYVDAGADVIETNTFGANRIKLQGHGLGDCAREINIAGARIALECAGSHALVAGSLGPTGKLLHPLGPMSFDEVYDSYREQVAALCEGGVDLLIIETIQDLREMKAALLAVRSVTKIPVICQMSFAQEGRTMMGTDPGTAAVVLEGMRPTLIGTNCGTGPQDMLDAVRAMSLASGIGVTAQPNAGLPRFYEGRLMYLSTPEYMAEFARQFVEAGAVMVGGCCGTTPEHTTALVAVAGGMKRAGRVRTDAVRLAGRSSAIMFGQGKPVLIGAGESASVVCIPCESDESASRLIEAAQSSGETALCLTGSDTGVLERALRMVEGRALVRSDAATDLLPIAAQYGAVVIADAVGDTPEERLSSARRILDEAVRHGLGKADILVNPGGVLNEDTLTTVRLIKSDLGLSTLVEYGPNDPRGDAAVSALKALVEAGVDAIAGDPMSPEIAALGLEQQR